MRSLIDGPILRSLSQLSARLVASPLFFLDLKIYLNQTQIYNQTHLKKKQILVKIQLAESLTKCIESKCAHPSKNLKEQV